MQILLSIVSFGATNVSCTCHTWYARSAMVQRMLGRCRAHDTTFDSRLEVYRGRTSAETRRSLAKTLRMKYVCSSFSLVMTLSLDIKNDCSPAHASERRSLVRRGTCPGVHIDVSMYKRVGLIYISVSNILTITSLPLSLFFNRATCLLSCGDRWTRGGQYGRMTRHCIANFKPNN